MRVTICGPNLNDQSKGEFHVHREGCGDLVRGARREPAYLDGWTVEARSREDVVRAIYSDQIGEQEGERAYFREHPDELASYPERYRAQVSEPVDWQDYDDLHVFDCCKQLNGKEG